MLKDREQQQQKEWRLHVVAEMQFHVFLNL